ncbi:MAG: hypothetical protein ABJO67_10795 [Pseudoruegeria sp.]
MDIDLYYIIGVTLLAFAIPSAISAIIDKQAPRLSAILIVIAGAMIIYAARETPGGLQLHTIPDAFINAVGKYLR